MWLGLPVITRQKIAEDWEMNMSGNIEVVDNNVISDGYTDKDLMVITEEGLRERVGRGGNAVPKDFTKLWEYYVSDISEENIKYSNDEKLNTILNKQLKKDLLTELDEQPKFKITRTQKQAEAIRKTSEPKKKKGR